MIINNIIIRKAIDIRESNEIANFKSKYFMPIQSASAISFETLNMDSLQGKCWLLNNFIKLNFPEETKINFIIQLSNQPNSKIIKYKGIWGILRNTDIDTNLIYNKKEIAIETEGGIQFLGFAEINIDQIELMIKLISEVDLLYFSLGRGYLEVDNYEDWINKYIDENKIVLFFLEDIWGGENEMVVINKNINLLNRLLM